MRWTRFFTPVPEWEADRVRELLETRPPSAYQLIDVRQPYEYRDAHLPGARLIPLDRLHLELGSLDPDRPLVVYCRSGRRSAAAVSHLLHHGLSRAVNMRGGILAWRGTGVTGDPAQRMAFLDPEMPVLAHLGIAWLLERATQEFYEQLIARRAAPLESCLHDLAAAEIGHQRLLETLVVELVGALPAGFPQSVVPGEPPSGVLEGGVDAAQASDWGATSDEAELLELAVACESMAFDRFATLAVRVPEGDARAALFRLADEERHHADRLLDELRRRAPPGV
jgi:rhodanese-related sulfurtransferase/rubrerythrin